MPDCGFLWRLYGEETGMVNGTLARAAVVGCPGCGRLEVSPCLVVRV